MTFISALRKFLEIYTQSRMWIEYWPEQDMFYLFFQSLDLEDVTQPAMEEEVVIGLGRSALGAKFDTLFANWINTSIGLKVLIFLTETYEVDDSPDGEEEEPEGEETENKSNVTMLQIVKAA